MRDIPKTLLDLTVRDALGNEQMKRLATRYRKPLREMLRQRRRQESKRLSQAWDSFFLCGPSVSDDFLPERADQQQLRE